MKFSKVRKILTEELFKRNSIYVNCSNDGLGETYVANIFSWSNSLVLKMFFNTYIVEIHKCWSFLKRCINDAIKTKQSCLRFLIFLFISSPTLQWGGFQTTAKRFTCWTLDWPVNTQPLVVKSDLPVQQLDSGAQYAMLLLMHIKTRLVSSLITPSYFLKFFFFISL